MRKWWCAAGLLILLFCLVLSAPYSVFPKQVHAEGKTFTNPIADEDTPDPWVIRKDGYYYMTFTHNGADIVVWKSKSLTDWSHATKVTVWTPPPGTPYSNNLWAPELHWIDGKWYIYFAADDGSNPNHRMVVLESDTPDPHGSYTFKGKIADPKHDYWAIDGTVMELNGKMYFIWSGWEQPSSVDIFPQNLYIAEMSNPWTISGPRHLLSTPNYPWEKRGQPINEGPEVLKHDGRVTIVYSAGGSWTPDYCLGMLTLKAGTDPLQAQSWIKSGSPVFQRNDEAGVYGPGHASFTKSPDGTEDWMVYHATSHADDGWNNRKARTQPFTWNGDGRPRFGRPVSTDTELKVPSGS